MRTSARTPEELETLLEDAFVLRDRAGVAALFAEGAVLAAGDAGAEARGVGQIARLAADLWDRGHTYVAHPRRVVQARDTALVVAASGLSVARRDPRRGWRYAIALVSHDHIDREEGL